MVWQTYGVLVCRATDAGFVDGPARIGHAAYLFMESALEQVSAAIGSKTRGERSPLTALLLEGTWSMSFNTRR